MVLKKLMLTLFKLFFCFFFIFSTYNLKPAISKEYIECNNYNSLNSRQYVNYMPIRSIDININEYKSWQINNLRILTNTSYLIPDKFKKKFNANVNVNYQNNISCKIKARIRTHGDLKDHIVYKNGKVFQSLDIDLVDGHINNITKFKLFLKNTRGNVEDEIFMTELLRQLNFIAPRTQLVKVIFNGEKNEMIFQEKSSKELLEYNKRKEGPILEGDEKYMMQFSSKVENKKGINWEEIFRVSELGTKIQLSKVTNSKWAVKNNNSKKNAFRALDKLNFAYLVYLNSFKEKKNNYFFLDYNLDNSILSQGIDKNLVKLDMFNNIILAANGNHALYVHNRKFYWNSEESYFEPIYYDGEFDLQKTQTKLNYPISPRYAYSLNKLKDIILNLDVNKLQKSLETKNLIFDKKRIQINLENLLRNLKEIEEMLEKKDVAEIEYNNNIYFGKKLKKNYSNNFKNQKIKAKFIQYDPEQNIFKICSEVVSICNENFNIDISDQRKLLESELKINGNNFEYLNLKNDNEDKYKKIILNDINFKNVYFYFNDGIDFFYDKENNIFNINQTNLIGRGFFLYGKINNIKINYNGNRNNFKNKLAKRLDTKNLTGCLNFIKIEFYNSNINSNNSTCEDGINIINSNGVIKKIISYNSLFDAIDLDFSDLLVDEIIVKNALNDCIDFSYGRYKVKKSLLESCGDKGVSVGEKSNADFGKVDLKIAQIGVASKDSSYVHIENARVSSVKNCYASYRKKQEFDGGFIKIQNSSCIDYSKNYLFDKNSKIEITINEEA